jgi:hypothetical protein
MKKKTKKKTKKIESCLDCRDHDVIADPDPNDWFCDNDVAIICKLAKNIYKDSNSKYSSDRQEFRILASSCRPYELKRSSKIPKWCPKKKKTKKKVAKK